MLTVQISITLSIDTFSPKYEGVCVNGINMSTDKWRISERKINNYLPKRIQMKIAQT